MALGLVVFTLLLLLERVGSTVAPASNAPPSPPEAAGWNVPPSSAALNGLLNSLASSYSKDNGSMWQDEDGEQENNNVTETTTTTTTAVSSSRPRQHRRGPAAAAPGYTSSSSSSSFAKVAASVVANVKNDNAMTARRPVAVLPRAPGVSLGPRVAEKSATLTAAVLIEEALKRRRPAAGADDDLVVMLRDFDDDSAAVAFDVPVLMGAAYRVAGVAATFCALSYVSVSAKLETAAYNAQYKSTLSYLAAMAALPALLFIVVYDSRSETLRDASRALWAGFAYAHAAAVFFSSTASLIIWLAALRFLEFPVLRNEFLKGESVWRVAWLAQRTTGRLSPTWRRTRFIAEFVSCVLIAPLIEELAKVWATRRAVALSNRATALSNREQKPHIHAYLTYSLAAALGLKLIDAARRVCAYTRPHHPQKLFFAILRGAFPIHELCAALTATRLAKRDLQGHDRWSMLRVVAPATVLHASAVFRGMKPAFKPATEAPWVELQLQAWNAPDDASAAQLLLKSAYSFMWWALLCRVLAYACHEYYSTARSALSYQSHHHHSQLPKQKNQPPAAPLYYQVDEPHHHCA